MAHLAKSLLASIQNEEKSLNSLSFLHNIKTRSVVSNAAANHGCAVPHFFSALCVMIWNVSRNITTQTLGYAPYRQGHHVFLFGPANIGKNNTLALVSSIRKYARELTMEYLVHSKVYNLVFFLVFFLFFF